MLFTAGQKLRAADIGSSLAEYDASALQTIANSTDTAVAFGTANFTSTLVTRGTTGSGHIFTLGRAGLWYVGATLRYVASASARETFVEIRSTEHGNLCAQSVVTDVNTATTMNISTMRTFDSGDHVQVNTFQSSGGNLNTDPSVGWSRFTMVWLGS